MSKAEIQRMILNILAKEITHMYLTRGETGADWERKMGKIASKTTLSLPSKFSDEGIDGITISCKAASLQISFWKRGKKADSRGIANINLTSTKPGAVAISMAMGPKSKVKLPQLMRSIKNVVNWSDPETAIHSVLESIKKLYNLSENDTDDAEFIAMVEQELIELFLHPEN